MNVKMMAKFFSCIVSIVDWRTANELMSSRLGLMLYLKMSRAKSILAPLGPTFSRHLLSLTAHVAVGIRVSLRPGVSMRLKLSNSTSLGSWVTP